MPNYNYKCKLHQIKAVAFDVDGVLTDGLVQATADGDLLRTYHCKDRMAMRMWLLKKYPMAIITGGQSESITSAFRLLGVPEDCVYQRSRIKLPDFLDFCSRHQLQPEEVAYVGDDLPDLPILQHCGLAVCPADAIVEVKAVCDYVSLYPGGRGCARDLIEQLLKVRGEWKLDLEAYATK